MAADFTLFRQVKKRGRKASNPSRLLPCSFRYVLMVRSRAEGTKQGYSLPGPRTWDPKSLEPRSGSGCSRGFSELAMIKYLNLVQMSALMI